MADGVGSETGSSDRHSRNYGQGGIDRRTFIRGAGALGVGLGAVVTEGALAGAAAAEEKDGTRLLIPRQKIGIGLEAYAFSQAPPADVYAELPEIRNMGYRFAELVEFGGFPGGVARAREVRRLLAKSNLRAVGNFHGTYTPGGGPNLRDSLDMLISEDKAAGMIDFGMVGTEHDATWQNEAKYRELARDFNRWGAATKRAGMRFYVHDEAYVFDRDPTTGKVLYDVLIEETDPELVFFCVDVMWMAYRGLDPVRYIELLEKDDRITHFHMKDWNGERPAPGAPAASTQTDVGAGTIDFRRIMKSIKRPQKYTYIVERELSPNPAETARRSYEYLANLRG